LWATTTAPDAPAVRLGVDAASSFVDVAGRAMFASGSSLWISDGTPGGTYAIADVGGSGASNMIVVGGQLYFIANSKLWRSDGTAEGTHLLLDIMPTSFSTFGSDPTDLTTIDGLVYFTAFDALYGSEPWTTDGTPEGTKLRADVDPGLSDRSTPHFYTKAGEH